MKAGTIMQLKATLRSLSTALALGGTLALSACTTTADLRKSQLATLTEQLPGNYGNPQQALIIMRVAAPLVGDQVFYVRETAANDARRIVSERVWSLQVAADGGIVGGVYGLQEPERWRSGVDAPELFRSLLMRDLRPLAGCELLWTSGVHGFSATSASERCPQRWRLEGDTIAFSEQPAASASPDPYFHFVRNP
jgi:hypothetical protein